jgi:hypothetical protein
MLAKFSNNARPDLCSSDRALPEAYAAALRPELEAVVRAGCALIQFDEPAWTAFPEEAIWGAEVLNKLTDGLGAGISLHVCCRNAYRKRAYTTTYNDLIDAFRSVRVDQVVLEHCTLNYDMITIWDAWDFHGEFAVGVIDQRSDEIETVDQIRGPNRSRSGALFRRPAPAHIRVRLSTCASRYHACQVARVNRGRGLCAQPRSAAVAGRSGPESINRHGCLREVRDQKFIACSDFRTNTLTPQCRT